MRMTVILMQGIYSVRSKKKAAMIQPNSKVDFLCLQILSCLNSLSTTLQYFAKKSHRLPQDQLRLPVSNQSSQRRKKQPKGFGFQRISSLTFWTRIFLTKTQHAHLSPSIYSILSPQSLNKPKFLHIILRHN